MNLRILYLLPLIIMLWASSASAQAGDRIYKFHSDVVIHEDTTMTVTETITVGVLGGDIKHGIFRDFPTTYKSKGGLIRKRGFKVESVSLDDRSVKYVVEKIEDGKRVRIGSAKVFLKPGTYTYEIKYKTTRQLGYFDDYDELYWNVTGNGWKFPIYKVTAVVILPPGGKVLKTGAWLGAVGSKDGAVGAEVLDDGRVRFISKKKLRPYQGVTIAVSFDKGHLAYENDKDTWWTVAKDNPVKPVMTCGLVLILGVLLVGWIREGIDPKKGTVIPLYDAPKGLSAAAVRFLHKTGSDDATFSVAVIALASKGALLIKKMGDTSMLVKREPHTALTPDEEDLYEALFIRKDKLVLAPVNAKILQRAKSGLEMNLKSLLIPGFFKKNSKYIYLSASIFCGVVLGLGLFFDEVELVPMLMHLITAIFMWVRGVSLRSKWNGSIRGWGALFGVACATLLWFITLKIIWNEGLHFLVLLCVLIEMLLVVFSHLVKAYTTLGRVTMDEVAGLRMYLKVAEEDRLNLENPPELTPEHFEKFLPFALALGVDQQWAEQFHNVLAAVRPESEGSDERSYRPSFYLGGSDGLGFSGVTAASAAIASTLGANLASASVSPSSSSSGGFSSGGGFSGGGGSSGGGGGGGGGGGW